MRNVVEVDAWPAVMHLVRHDEIQAVFLRPPTADDGWRDEVTLAVESGHLQLPRAELVGLDIDRIASWLDAQIPQDCVSSTARDALISDILDLLHMQTSLTGTTTYRLRILAEAPTRRCGFHVDTVAPGVPPWGMLRVYNGAGPFWTPAANVTSMDAFYRWLRARDLVVRRFDHDLSQRDRRLEELDQALPFLVDPLRIAQVTAGTTVIFRHLDASLHWCDHSPRSAWLHCSPKNGPRRLVVNVSPARPGPAHT